MGETRNTYNILVGDVAADEKTIFKRVDSIHLAQDSNQWRAP
jgi:hypothetical protein